MDLESRVQKLEEDLAELMEAIQPKQLNIELLAKSISSAIHSAICDKFQEPQKE